MGSKLFLTPFNQTSQADLPPSLRSFMAAAHWCPSGVNGAVPWIRRDRAWDGNRKRLETAWRAWPLSISEEGGSVSQQGFWKIMTRAERERRVQRLFEELDLSLHNVNFILWLNPFQNGIREACSTTDIKDCLLVSCFICFYSFPSSIFICFYHHRIFLNASEYIRACATCGSGHPPLQTQTYQNFSWKMV